MAVGKGHHVHLIDGLGLYLPRLPRAAAIHIAVIFDHASLTFRNEMYPAYKASRPDAGMTGADRPPRARRSPPKPTAINARSF